MHLLFKTVQTISHNKGGKKFYITFYVVQKLGFVIRVSTLLTVHLLTYFFVNIHFQILFITSFNLGLKLIPNAHIA